MLSKINKRRIITSIIAIVLGVALAVFSEYDDAPGGVLLGFVMIIAGVIGIMKSKKKTLDS